MTFLVELTIVDSRLQPAASCMVCGKDVAAGEGVTARYGVRTLRFKCPGCYGRFTADPEAYLAGRTGGCCGKEHHAAPAGQSGGPPGGRVEPAGGTPR